MTARLARSPLAWFLVALATILAASCKSAKQEEEVDRRVAELRRETSAYANSLAAVIEATADAASRKSPDLESRREQIAWKKVVIPAVRDGVNTRDPVDGFLDVWVYTLQLRAFFASEGHELDETGPMVMEAMAQLQREIERVGTSFLGEKQMEDARREVQEFAETHALERPFLRPTVMPSSLRASGAGVFSWARIPNLNPFGGLDEGAEAIREFTVVADRFTSVVQGLADETRWQLELLAIDVEELPTTQTLVESFAKVADQSERIAGSVERLPEETRSVIETVFEEVDEHDEAVVATLDAIDRTLARAEETIAALGSSSESVARAGQAWEATALAFRGPEEEEPAPAEEEGGGGFDPVALGEGADHVASAAIELRSLVADVRDMLESGVLSQPVEELDRATRATVDHAVWRLGQLAGVLLVAGIVLRLVGGRARRRKA